MEALWQDMKYEDYQIKGIQWMQRQERKGGGILADEMGLGKTIQVLGLIKNSEAPSKNLLIGPLAVLGQWEDAAQRSGFKVKTYKNGAWISERSTSEKEVWIVNYEKLNKLISTTSFYENHWTRVICDEAHRLRNRGKAFDAIGNITYRNIYLLTATPIVNGLDDSLAYFMLLGVMDFVRKYFINDDRALIKNYVLARSRQVEDKKKEDAFSAICPEINKIFEKKGLNQDVIGLILEYAGIDKVTHEIHSKILEFKTDEEAEFYNGVQGTIVRRWRALEGENTTEILVLLMRLRQLSIHPQVYIASKKKTMKSYNRADWSEPSTKFEEAWNLIQEETKEHSWILFCNFREEVALLKRYLEGVGFDGKIHTYDGSMSAKARQEAIDASHSPGQHIFLVQIHAGGTGINLQHFSRVIFLSPWWTSALMEQAAGRVLRIGQKKHVKIYNLLLEGEVGINIDKRMRTAVDKKKRLLEEFLFEARH